MKGLENRWIILPDLARLQQLDRWEPVSVGLVRPRGEPAVALSVKDQANSAAVWRRREDRLHEEAEETRLLYVALTRATDRLVVVAGPSRRDAPWLEALRPWGFDADAPPSDGAILCDGHVVHRSFAVPQSDGGLEPYLHQSADRAVARFATALERMTADAAPIAPSRMADESRGPAGRDRRGDGTARVVGIVLHRLLERRSGEDRAATHALAVALSRETAEAEETDVVTVEREVRTLVDRLFDSGLAERLDRIDAVGRELPILMRADDGGVIRGTIDLLYRETDGRLVVADFKTDRETDPSRLVATYGPQIDLYAEAVRRATGRPLLPARELWALRSGDVLRLPE
jgi:ATP-dependent helicase/nuclease subunit A